MTGLRATAHSQTVMPHLNKNSSSDNHFTKITSIVIEQKTKRNAKTNAFGDFNLIPFL